MRLLKARLAYGQLFSARVRLDERLPMMPPPRPFPEAFPNFYRVTAETGTMVPPLFSFSFDSLLEMSVDSILEGQTLDRKADAVFSISEALLVDLGALEVEAAGNAHAERILQFLRFIICQAPFTAAVALGLTGKAHDWFYHSISTEHDPAKSYNEGYVFWPIAQEGDSSIALRALREFTPGWLANLYVLARTTTGLGKPAERFYEPARELAVARLKDGWTDEPTVMLAAALLSWTQQINHLDLAPLAETLFGIWSTGHLPRAQATILGQVFCTAAAEHTPRTALEWADLLLTDYAGDLREHQRLQLLSVTVETPADWSRRRDVILEEIRKVALDTTERAAVLGGPRHYTLEARINIINPIVHRLIGFADLKAILDVLFAWYARPGATRCDGQVLFVCPSYELGTAYLWPGGSWISPADAFDRLGIASNDAFGHPQVMADQEVSFPPGWSEQREGLPVFDQGPHFEDAIRAHYGTTELGTQVGAVRGLRSMLTYPALRDAAPAVINDALGLQLDIESTLGAGAPARPLRKCSVWADRTFTTQFEVACVVEAGRVAGFEVVLHSRSERTLAEDFRDFYEDETADLLWVIGHGAFEAHDPAASGLQFHDAPILSWEELGQWRVPNQGRRLLILNVCSGADVIVTGGVGRIGLAADLVGTYQTVVGHRWAVDGGVALALGAMAASHLAQGAEPLQAFRDAITGLRRPDTIGEHIRNGLGLVEVVERLAPDTMSGVLNWGCPAVLT